MSCADPQEPQSSNAADVANKSAPTSVAGQTRGHRALRRWRTSIPERTYFITACTHRRQALFDSAEIADLVFHHLHRLEVDLHLIQVTASVVMPDHVHAVLTLCDSTTLDDAMKRLRGSSALAINRVLGREGPLWQRGYFDRLLRVDDRLETVLHYLWHNPTPPGLNFRCRRETWDWFRTCVRDKIEYYEWLKRNP